MVAFGANHGCIVSYICVVSLIGHNMLWQRINTLHNRKYQNENRNYCQDESEISNLHFMIVLTFYIKHL